MCLVSVYQTAMILWRLGSVFCVCLAARPSHMTECTTRGPGAGPPFRCISNCWPSWPPGLSTFLSERLRPDVTSRRAPERRTGMDSAGGPPHRFWGQGCTTTADDYRRSEATPPAPGSPSCGAAGARVGLRRAQLCARFNCSRAQPCAIFYSNRATHIFLAGEPVKCGLHPMMAFVGNEPDRKQTQGPVHRVMRTTISPAPLFEEYSFLNCCSTVRSRCPSGPKFCSGTK